MKVICGNWLTSWCVNWSNKWKEMQLQFHIILTQSDSYLLIIFHCISSATFQNLHWPVFKVESDECWSKGRKLFPFDKEWIHQLLNKFSLPWNCIPWCRSEWHETISQLIVVPYAVPFHLSCCPEISCFFALFSAPSTFQPCYSVLSLLSSLALITHFCDTAH